VDFARVGDDRSPLSCATSERSGARLLAVFRAGVSNLRLQRSVLRNCAKLHLRIFRGLSPERRLVEGNFFGWNDSQPPTFLKKNSSQEP